MLEAIQLDNANPKVWMGYTHKGIMVTPEPIQVGRPATITLSLQNQGTTPIVIRKIEPKIAKFGIGTKWTQLPSIDSFILPATGEIKEVPIDWLPMEGGHRCIRAFIHTSRAVQPLCVGRNLQIIQADPSQSRWQTPFRLGNPRELRMPVYLALHAEGPVQAQILVEETPIRPGEAIWLDPGQEVNGMVLLTAQTSAEIARSISVEATIGEQFIDGFQVDLYRAAQIRPTTGYYQQDEQGANYLEEMVLVA